MNTNQLKRFAQAARKKLIEQVGAKLQFVLTHDTAELRGKQEALKKLKEAQKSLGDEALIEKVAYTWFNRMVALRFMDVNDYQPLGLQVISPPTEGGHVPALLEAAHAGQLPEDLGVNTAQINDILDGKTGAANPDNEVFRQLLVAACNQLSEILPFLFEKINDYTELLLPDDLTSNRSIVNDVVEGMSAEDCAEVEIIGWLYQFYISEKKEAVDSSTEKVSKENIPAATQLFTPRWIVEYMVQNTVGKLWLQNRPQSKLRDYMPYYIESPSAETEDHLKVSSPEELTLLDQACGSGHILVYGFELLSKIYEEEGFNPSEIPALIIKNNLFGFEIDERAAQLAGMAVLMKARAYHRRFFRKGEVPEPQILCFQDLKLSEDEIKNLFEKLNLKPSDELIHDLGNMQQATNFGSLITPHASDVEIQKVLEDSINLKMRGDVFIQYQADQLSRALHQLNVLNRKFHAIVDNPPYLGSRKMNKVLTEFLNLNGFSEVSRDLYSSFIKRGLTQLLPNGMLGMITQISWMYTKDFIQFRKNVVSKYQLKSSIILGSGAFETINGEVVKSCSFVYENSKPNEASLFIDVTSYSNKIEGFYHGKKFKSYCLDYLILNEAYFAYKLTADSIKRISQSERLSDYVNVKQGLATGNNDRFVRYNWEVTVSKFSSNLEEYTHPIKWVPYDKGGGYRKHYGNNLYVVNWENDGFEIKNFKDSKGKQRSRPQNLLYYFREGFTFNLTGRISYRFKESGHVFDVQGSSVFYEEEENSRKFLFLALLNSKVSTFFTEMTNPTMVTQVGDVSKIPMIHQQDIEEEIVELEHKCVELAKKDWNLKETSYDFEFPFFKREDDESLEERFELFFQFCETAIKSMISTEIEINSKFIQLYDLHGVVDSDVHIEDISIFKEEITVSNGNFEIQNDVTLAQFVSYSVGCMFGRYSLDKGGLILADKNETLLEFFAKVGKSESEVSFLPDDDNIIPVLDDEWFEDDIVGRFHAFLKASFGEKNFRKNLDFVEECLGKNVRKYFTKDFYKDHIKRYKKRPIYWMFSSPKGHFNVLVYLHRYTPDTISTILNSYLREFIEKLNLQMKQLKQVEISGSASEQAKARKEMDKLDLMLDDCREYEEILFELASERIALDLDDGVLVNYNKMGKAVAEVPGLNDKKAKDKVKGFDWIDTSLIR